MASNKLCILNIVKSPMGTASLELEELRKKQFSMDKINFHFKTFSNFLVLLHKKYQSSKYLASPGPNISEKLMCLAGDNTQKFQQQKSWDTCII